MDLLCVDLLCVAVRAVNQAFPVNWIWWVTLIVATLLVSLTAEVLIYRLRELKDIELGH